MTDEELIEQVARAICDADQWCGLYDRLKDDERSVYQRDARAILPIIKSDRAEVRAELVAEIVDWLRDEANGWMCADTASSEIEAKFGGRDETR